MFNEIRVAATSDVPDPGKILVEADGRLLALFHVAGKYYALDDVCTHDGGTLADGKLEGTTIACPRHGAKFDICTGKALTMPATKPTGSYATEVRGTDVFVKIES
jgi:3-phenylpropionate/trans-cinnamate dioxygenase ferredoxin subunit